MMTTLRFGKLTIDPGIPAETRTALEEAAKPLAAPLAFLDENRVDTLVRLKDDDAAKMVAETRDVESRHTKGVDRHMPVSLDSVRVLGAIIRDGMDVLKRRTDKAYSDMAHLEHAHRHGYY